MHILSCEKFSDIFQNFELVIIFPKLSLWRNELRKKMWAPIGNFICEVVGEKLRKWERLGSSESVGMLWSLVVLCTLLVWWRLRASWGEVGREEGSGLLSHGPAGELGDWDAEGSEMLWVGRCGGFDALRCIEMDWDGLICFEMDWDNGRGCSEASSSQLIRSFPH